MGGVCKQCNKKVSEKMTEHYLKEHTEVLKCPVGDGECDGDHSKYTLENYPNLKYGPTNSPNPPHMRGKKGEQA